MPYFKPGLALVSDEGGYQSAPLSPLPVTPTGSPTATGPTALSGRKMPIAISIPGYIITDDESYSEAAITEELFEDLSLYELMDFGRSETVLGQNVLYKPIKNISDIYFTYSPKKILALSGNPQEVESATSLDLSLFFVDGAVFRDEETGDILIAADNIKNNMVIQVEILSGGEIKDS